jgi:glycosyltransferase involved in cell wall biosynthesis
MVYIYLLILILILIILINISNTTDESKLTKNLIKKYLLYSKNCNKKPKIYLISHENSNTGAPLYLYNLQQYFNKMNYSTKFVIGNKIKSDNLIIQNYEHINSDNIINYIFEDCVDWELYKSEYSDVKNMDKKSIINHIIQYGINENRNINFTNTPTIICNTITTYNYVLNLSNLNLKIFWVIHEWFNKNNYFTNFYDKIKQVENVNIIFPCEGANNNNKKYFNLNNKQYVIPSGFDPDILLEKQNNKINLRENIKLDNPIIISIIGTIEKRKNQQDFIDNVFNILQKKYNNLVLVLVGKETEKLREDTNKNSIMLTGLVNNPISYINESDIIVSHSLNEVLPINIIESMFCSKPIVSSNAGCSSSEVINNINGYIYNNNEECIKYLSMLIEDKNKRDLMGLKSNELFYENFTTKNYNKFFEILNNNY